MKGRGVYSKHFCLSQRSQSSQGRIGINLPQRHEGHRGEERTEAAAQLSQRLGLGNNAKDPGRTKSKLFILPTPFHFLCTPCKHAERDLLGTSNNGKCRGCNETSEGGKNKTKSRGRPSVIQQLLEPICLKMDIKELQDKVSQRERKTR